MTAHPGEEGSSGDRARPPVLAPAGAAMLAVYSAAGALAGIATALRALAAAGDEAVRLAEKRGLWAGHAGASDRPWLWLHGASVGEVEIALALALALRSRLAGTRVVVTATTATGRARARREQNVECRAFPIDFAPFVRRILGTAPPLLFVAVETEIWPATLRVLGAAGVPAAVANARLSDASLPRYRRARSLIGPLVAGLAKICARDAEAARRWVAIGARESAVTVTGNIKFDLASQRRDEKIAPLFDEIPGRPLLLAASTHDGEEGAALDAFAAVRARRPGVRLLIAPRHPERAGAVLAEARRRGGRTVTAWSEIVRDDDGAGRAAGGGAGWPADADILVLDRLGLLRRAYASADAAFVGGSLGEGPGGHNLLEGVMAACPLAAGPHLGNVADQAEVLGEAHALRIVNDVASLSKFWMEVLDSPAVFRRCSESARALVEARRGALDATVEALLPLIAGREKRA